MNYHLLLTALASLCFVGCFERSAKPSGTTGTIDKLNGPSLSILPPEINLGDVFLGESKSFAAKVVNVTDRIVSIDSLHAGCGCTSFEVNKRALRPGEEANLIGSFRADSGPGEFSKSLTVASNGNPPSVATAAIRGNAIRSIDFTPARIVLSPDVKKNLGDTAVIKVTNRSASPLSLVEVLGLPADMTAMLPVSQVSPGASAEICFSAPSTACTVYDGDIVLSTTHGHERAINIPFLIRPVHQIVVAPDRLFLGVVSKEELLSRGELRITVSGEILNNAETRAIEVPSFLKVVAEENNSSQNSLTVGLRFLDMIDKALLDGSIRIRLSMFGGSVETSLAIPITGLVKDN